MKSKLYFILILTSILSCTQKHAEEKSYEPVQVAPQSFVLTDTSKVDEQKSEEKDISKPKSNVLRKFSKADVAKFTIASIMGQSPSIIKTRNEGEYYSVFYTRTSDGQKFSYKIKFEEENKVMWGNSDGRWRNSVYDERITYSEANGKLTITQAFEDGSSTNDIYTK